MTASKVLAAFIVLCSISLFAGGKSKSTVTVMTYNVENLFDTLHDEGKRDYDFLPLELKRKSPEIQAYCKGLKKEHYRKRCLTLNWDKAKLRRKISQIAKVIRLVNNGRGPDILVVEEVENLNALRQLVNYGLSGMGYLDPVLIEGPDKRGIDIGMISKFPHNHAKYHHVNVEGRPTRGILNVQYQIGSAKLTVLGNHWPSQNNPDEKRMAAAYATHKALQNIKGPVIVTGDFNTLDDDSPHGVNTYLLNSNVSPTFYDAEAEHIKSGGFPFHDLKSPGTHWYSGKWSSLDKIFVIKNKKSKLGRRINANWLSYAIVSENFMVHDVEYEKTDDNGNKYVIRGKRVPKRFNWDSGEGFSDHLPAVLNVEL